MRILELRTTIARGDLPKTITSHSDHFEAGEWGLAWRGRSLYTVYINVPVLHVVVGITSRLLDHTSSWKREETVQECSHLFSMEQRK